MCEIPKKESLTVEFKSDKKELPDSVILDVVVAFANTEGGEFYLGVEDDGTPTGVHPHHKDITRLGAFIANQTVPSVSVRAEMILVSGVSVLKVSVPKCSTIVATSSGKILRRRLKADGSPQNIPLYPYEIESRLSSLSLLDVSAQVVPDASRDDFDPVERERLRNMLRQSNGETNLLELDDLELDKALRFVVRKDDDYKPTLTGLLLIGRADRLRELVPTNESAFQLMRGTDIRVNESFSLPLLASLDKIYTFFEAENREEEVDTNLLRIPLPQYDKRAFREALINAYSHRDYTRLGRVRVVLEDTGLTITSPGGFIEGVRADNLIEAEPHGRNPLLADCLKRIGLAERSGRGIDRIYEGSLRYGKPAPDYSASNMSRVSVFIPKSHPDVPFMQMLQEEQEKYHHVFSIYELLVLNQLKIQRRLNLQDFVSILHLSAYRLRMTLENLTEMGILETVGGKSSRAYILSARIYKSEHQLTKYVRQKGIEDTRYGELILSLLRKQKRVTRSDAAELLHITPSQAYRQLKALEQEGKIILQGRGRSACYVLRP